jgi:hypothetical protein
MANKKNSVPESYEVTICFETVIPQGINLFAKDPLKREEGRLLRVVELNDKEHLLELSESESGTLNSSIGIRSFLSRCLAYNKYYREFSSLLNPDSLVAGYIGEEILKKVMLIPDQLSHVEFIFENKKYCAAYERKADEEKINLGYWVGSGIEVKISEISEDRYNKVSEEFFRSIIARYPDKLDALAHIYSRLSNKYKSLIPEESLKEIEKLIIDDSFSIELKFSVSKEVKIQRSRALHRPKETEIGGKNSKKPLSALERIDLKIAEDTLRRIIDSSKLPESAYDDTMLLEQIVIKVYKEMLDNIHRKYLQSEMVENAIFELCSKIQNTNNSDLKKFSEIVRIMPERLRSRIPLKGITNLFLSKSN